MLSRLAGAVARTADANYRSNIYSERARAVNSAVAYLLYIIYVISPVPRRAGATGAVLSADLYRYADLDARGRRRLSKTVFDVVVRPAVSSGDA